MNPIFAVILVLTCASAQDFRNVKQVRMEVEVTKDPSATVQEDKTDSNKVTVDNGPNLSGRIINGSKATLGQFPWQALIYMDNRNMCGGSIISSKWILTAAHCAAPFSSFVIYVGKTDRINFQSSQQTKTTSIKIVNVGYNSATIANDIALLQVQPFTFNNYAYAVQLPKMSDAAKTFAGQKSIVSGFGVTASGSISSTLQYAQVTVISNSQCKSYYGSYILNSNICTEVVNNKGTCFGDSGGPLVYLEGTNYTQIGVVSFVSSSSCTAGPDGFTRVTSYLCWISQNTGITLRN